MKAILKVADLRKISKATGLELDELKNGAYWLNRGDSARSCFTRSEYEAIALYLVTREVNEADLGGQVSGARAICGFVDSLLGFEYRTTLGLVKAETLRAGRWVIAELNTGLDHLTLTNANPYAKNLGSLVAI